MSKAHLRLVRDTLPELEPIRALPLVYLGSPYSKYPAGIEQAFKDVSALAGRLLSEGVKAYSPIAHTHPIAVHGNLDPYDHNIWLPFDAAIMEKSDGMIVAMMEGWDSSYGIKHEIEIFMKTGKPIFYLDPVTLGVTNV
jgi:hypothetical protein